MTDAIIAASPGTPATPSVRDPLEASLRGQGYAFVPASAMRRLLAESGGLSDWQFLAASWDDLALDAYMADHGRYRRRRHAVFSATAGGPIRHLPPRPHYQDLEYNPLNGGVERWFEPVRPEIARSECLATVLACCRDLFDRQQGEACDWFVELHQFRIEARPGEAGLPTPEGMHRDGVDHVLVLLVQRVNILSGTTLIGTPREGIIGSFTLAEPLDAALVDDHRVHHAVTPVQPMDPDAPAWRDVLVVTFKRIRP